MVVPVAGVSLLTQHALSEALSISRSVVAVNVIITDDADDGSQRERELRAQWDRWNPGVPLRVLHTEFASVAGPIVGFIDELSQSRDEQIVVLTGGPSLCRRLQMGCRCIPGAVGPLPLVLDASDVPYESCGAWQLPGARRPSTGLCASERRSVS